MKVTVVGTGTASLRMRRHHSCVVVETGEETLVFDAGLGAGRGIRRSGIDPLDIDRVFFTHFHADHTMGFAPLLAAIRFAAWRRRKDGGETSRRQPLPVAGPEPFADFWRSHYRAWGRWLVGSYPVEISELPRECSVPIRLPGCDLSWAPADHRAESIAYRLDSGGGSFVYTGDTGYAESVVELARGAHTVLIDCSFPDSRPFPGHLTPGGVARLASEAGVGRVILTHISPEAERLDLVSEVGRGYGGEVILAEDGLHFEV